ncbi:MAG: hypothetical protein NTW69_09335 [Chloroflexi bacterium]|nr:hypothetical protein [Chloroflexota bacterium]
MKIIKNEKLISRNGKIGQYTSLGALVVLGLGMYISFSKPDLFTYSVICLLVGFIMTQVGMYMGNRWGRSPRPDEKFDTGLKGLPGEFNMYHWPSGAWVLLPFHQKGKVEFTKNRWRMSGGGFMQMYMRIFGQESIGRPEIDAENEVQTLKKFFAKKLDESFIPEINPILVFTSDEAELEVGDSPIPAMKLKQLKEFMRQGVKNRVLTVDQIAKITSLFDKE